MDGLRKWIPSLEYREFMLNLSRQITAQDMAELKYMLVSPEFPEGKMESLKTALELFRFLEHMRFVEPSNLGNLKELFRSMGKAELFQMTTKFIQDGNTQTVESSRIRYEDDQKIGLCS